MDGGRWFQAARWMDTYAYHKVLGKQAAGMELGHGNER